MIPSLPSFCAHGPQGSATFSCKPTGRGTGRVVRAGGSGAAEDVVLEGAVFGPSASAAELYTGEMEAGVASCVQSLDPRNASAHAPAGTPSPYSCALLVYGHQSSGKSYTLLGRGAETQGSDARQAGEALLPSPSTEGGDCSAEERARGSGTALDSGLADPCLRTLFDHVALLRQRGGTGGSGCETGADGEGARGGRGGGLAGGADENGTLAKLRLWSTWCFVVKFFCACVSASARQSRA